MTEESLSFRRSSRALKTFSFQFYSPRPSFQVSHGLFANSVRFISHAERQTDENCDFEIFG